MFQSGMVQELYRYLWPKAFILEKKVRASNTNFHHRYRIFKLNERLSDITKCSVIYINVRELPN